MGRKNLLEGLIVEALRDGKPKTLREIQKETGIKYWNTIYYNLITKENSLVSRGCVEVVEDYPEAKEFEGNLERKFRLNDINLC